MMEKIVVQDIVSISRVIEKYYGLISILNDLHLTVRDIQLIAHIAVKGSLKDKEEFYLLYNTTSATVYNSISKLRKLEVLIKKDRMIVVNPLICPKFDNGISLNLQLRHE